MDKETYILEQVNSNLIYSIHQSSNKILPTSINKWIADISILSNNEWENIFTLPHILTNIPKIIIAQFKILHRIVNRNSNLYTWKIKDTDTCSFCNNKDSIVHYFILFKKGKQLWISLSKWWNHNQTIQVELSREDILENVIIFCFNKSDNSH